EWLARLDRPVLALEARPLEGAGNLHAWAMGNGQDADLLRRLNPALTHRWTSPPLALVPAIAAPPPVALDAIRATAPADEPAAAVAATAATGKAGVHTVRSGESAWAIARRYGVAVRKLLELNNLGPNSVLRPGMKLRIEDGGGCCRPLRPAAARPSRHGCRVAALRTPINQDRRRASRPAGIS